MQNARCVPSYDFSKQNLNVQRKFAKKIVAVYGNVMNRQDLQLKEHLAGKKFDEDDELQEEFMSCFKGLAADFYVSGKQKLFPRLKKCLDSAGKCVEK